MSPSPDSALRALSDDLRGFDVARVSGESLCLSLGDTLGKASDEFQRLTASFKAVETVFTGNELETLSRAIGEIRETVAGMSGGLDAECDSIETLVRLADTIDMRFDLIRRSMRTISALAINSRVEAASVDSRSGEVSAFAQELVNLAGQAQKAIDGCCREHADLAKILKISQNTLTGFKQRHSAELTAAERDLGEVGTALTEHRAHIASAVAQLASRSNAIMAAIGTIVMALQIGDSTRQRAEHALEVLVELPSLYTDAQDIRAASAVACELGSLLLGGARADFTSAAGRISTSLLNLVHQADEIVAMAGEVGRQEQGDSLSFIENIKTKLGAALTLSENSGAARAQVDAAVAEMAKSTGRLDRQTEDLSGLTVAMTMIGINAILKAKRVGTAGLGLGVIADQLRAVADKVVIEVNEVKPMLGQAVIQTRILADTLANRRGDRMDRGVATASAALATFASHDQNIVQAIETLVQSGSRVARDLETAAMRPDAHDAGLAMDEMRGSLLDCVEALSADTPPLPDLAGLRAAFAKRYTMAAERDIHSAFWSSDTMPDERRFNKVA